MMSAEILRKAIVKAIQNGWYIGDYKVVNADPVEGTYCVDVWFSDDTTIEIAKHDLFYRHDFAKAFWGEKKIVPEMFINFPWASSYAVISWQYHLQQMVLEEDQFKYLEKFL